MAVFRVERTKDFTIMSNHHLRNRNLSLKAKGMLSLMLSLPDDWDYTMAGLAHICRDGLSCIRGTIAELEEHGYLKRRRLRNDKGQLTETEYTILERPARPQTGPKSAFRPYMRKPHAGFTAYMRFSNIGFSYGGKTYGGKSNAINIFRKSKYSKIKYT